MGKTSKCETISSGTKKYDQYSGLKLIRHVHFRVRKTNNSDSCIMKPTDSKQLISLLTATKVDSYIFCFNYHALLHRHPKFLFLCLQRNQHTELMIKSLNSNRENLLHVACKYNRSEFIDLLLRRGCNPAKQNFDGLTPLHIALQYNHMECIAEFLRVMASLSVCDLMPNDLPILEGLKNMFRFYTHTGYTIVHLAVVKNLPDTLKDLLQFCQRHHIDVLQAEVLGCGDSLLHLAVKSNAIDVINVIVDLLPESIRIPNYTGIMPYDCAGISDELRKLIKSKMKR